MDYHDRVTSYDSTPRHPIRVVAQRTGLTTATIRAWERRYGAVEPTRSDGGQRLYSDLDLERLGTLRELTEAGRPISMVAALPPEEAAALLLEDRVAATHRGGGDAEAGTANTVEGAYALVRSFDADGLERLLWRSALTLGGRRFLGDLVGPLLQRVGSGWQAGEVTPAQEHLASEVVEQLLERLADRARSSDGPVLVVATLPGERHGLGARLFATAAVLEGWGVKYLGTDLPVAEIVAAAEGVDAAAVAVSLVRRERLDETAQTLAALRSELDPGVELFVGGAAAGLLEAGALPAGIWLHDGLEDVPAPPVIRRR